MYLTGEKVSGLTGSDGMVTLTSSWDARSFQIVKSGYKAILSLEEGPAEAESYFMEKTGEPVWIGFHVYDRGTLANIANATVTISDSYGNSASATTGSDGSASFETTWTPEYVGITALGYETYSGPAVPDVTNPIPMDPVPTVLVAFHVYDNISLGNVAGASVTISDAYGNSLSGTTNSAGLVSFETVWTPQYVDVSASGYYDYSGPVVPETTNPIGLDPVIVYYDVLIWTSAGGSVNPSGIITVKAGTKITVTATPNSGYILDYWLVNDVNTGNTNPLGATIDRQNFSINAIFKESEVPPPPPNGNGWPVSRQIHLLDNVKIETGWGTWKEKSRPITGVDMGVLIGAKISYTINFASSVLPGVHVYFYVNDVEVGVIFPPLKEPVSGEIDITGYLTETNVFKVGVSAGPGGFNVVYIDEWVTLGYSEEPETEPKSPWNPYWEWIVKNWKWLAVGGGGLFALYLFTRKGPPIIVIPEYRPRRREEY